MSKPHKAPAKVSVKPVQPQPRRAKRSAPSAPPDAWDEFEAVVVKQTLVPRLQAYNKRINELESLLAQTKRLARTVEAADEAARVALRDMDTLQVNIEAFTTRVGMSVA